MPKPTRQENVIGIDTGVHVDQRGHVRLTITRIDGRNIETSAFER